MSTASSGSKPSQGWQPPTLEEMQAMLSQYEFISLLGRGGMGAVYKAVQVSLDRPVAIKVLPGELIDDTDAQFAERFKNEARTMAKMNHPAIVNVWEFGETSNGLLYIVMEFIDGTDVLQMIRSQGRLPEDYALSITAHVCDALAYAHANGVIHRDIKPANILINMEGEVKVADFGLAKQSDTALSGLTKTNMAMGTPDFVAPEALSPGTVVDGRADLYAVGVMLYQMLTGEIPRGMWTLPGTKLGTDPRFDGIILRAMQTDREQRYQSAAEIRQELHTITTTPRAMQQQAAASPTSAITAGMPQQKPTGQRPMSQGPRRPQQQPTALETQNTRQKSGNSLFYGMAAVVAVGLLLVVMLSGREQPSLPTKTDAVADVAATSEPAVTPAIEPANNPPTTTVPVPAPDPSQPPAGQTFPVNLLAQVDVPRDAVAGEWEVTPEGLLSRPSQDRQIFEFQYRPPEEYNFEIEFTPRQGSMEAMQIVPVNGKSLLWKMGAGGGTAWVHVFGPSLDGVSWRVPTRTEARTVRPRFNPGERHRCVLEVRKNSIRAVLDGEEVMRWNGDLKHFTGEDGFATSDPSHLGLASWNTEVVFHKAVLRRPGAPSAVAASPPAQKPIALSVPVAEPMTEEKDMPLAERKKLLAAPLAAGDTDLLKSVKALPGNVTFAWERTAEGLAVKYLKNPDPYKSCIALPGLPPQDYVAEVWFTIPQPGEHVGLTIPVGDDRVTTCWISPENGGWAGLGKVDGKDPESPEIEKGCSSPFQLPAGEPVLMRAEVRRTPGTADIRFFLNGRQMAHYHGPTKRLFFSTAWYLQPPRRLLQIGARHATFHRVTVRRLAAPAVAEPPVVTTPAVPEDPYLTKLASGFKAAYETQAQEPFLNSRAKLDLNYVANGLARARASAQSDGRNDELAVLEAEKAAIEKGSGVPAADRLDTPESLKDLRATYRTALSKLKDERNSRAAPLYDIYLKALDSYVTELTKKNKIPEALRVTTLRDQIAQEQSLGLLPAFVVGQSMVSNSLGMKFVPLEGTNVLFCIHETRRQDYAAYAAEVSGVDSGWRDMKFEGVPSGDKNDHPAVGLSWEDAAGFCKWLSQKEGRTYRLPTDEEWSIAVGLGPLERRGKNVTPESLSQRNTSLFPWGDSYPPQSSERAGNYCDVTHQKARPALPIVEGYDDGFVTTSPVMSFKPNRLGIYDLGGNVWEWTDDWYNSNHQERVLRGAAYLVSRRETLLSSFRMNFVPSSRFSDLGFRCVLEKP